MVHLLGAYGALAVYNLGKLATMLYSGIVLGHDPGWRICLYDMEDAILLELAPLLLAVPYMTIRRTGGFDRRAWAVTRIPGHPVFS